MKPNGTAHPTLAKFFASRGHYTHISAPIIENPLAIIARAKNEIFHGPQMVVGHRKTLNAGRNQAKRTQATRRYG
jgi:1,2-phenylacetyl-CoA epoxidase catalytic subunit